MAVQVFRSNQKDTVSRSLLLARTVGAIPYQDTPIIIEATRFQVNGTDNERGLAKNMNRARRMSHDPCRC